MQSGMIEVYTEFEKKEFVIERLFKGSIVNYRTFFMEERGSVNLRFAAPSVLKVLSKEKMNVITERHPHLGTVFNKYKLKIVKDSKAIPLDYVMALPKKITDQLIKDTRKKLLSGRQDELRQRVTDLKSQYSNAKGLEMSDDQVHKLKQRAQQEIVSEKEVKEYRARTNLLENRLKNIVIRQIVRIREERNKQTIKEAVDAILKVNQAAKDKRSKKVEKHVKRELEQNGAKNLEVEGENDILYNRVIVNMKRLLKKLTGHSNAIDSLERKLREISAPKKKKKVIQRAIDQIKSEMQGSRMGEVNLNIDNLDGMDDLDGDNEGIRGYAETPTPPEYKDEIDKLSEGAFEREIMMDQIRMVEVDKMDEYKKYTLKLDNNTSLKINDSDELESVSSEDSGEPDKDIEDDQ